jgi:hypothetical protein
MTGHNTHLGKWSEPGVPHRGWECIFVDDLGEPSQICEMCESQEIRYVHHMHHPGYSDVLEVGCICAGHMEEDLKCAQKREDAVKKAGARRKRWPSLKGWHLSRNGNSVISKDGYRTTIFKQDGFWSGVISNERTGAKTFAKRRYPTEMAAKLGAFDGIIWLQSNGD